LRALRARAADVARVRARVVAIRAENERRAAALASAGVVAPAVSAAAITITSTTAAAGNLASSAAGATNMAATKEDKANAVISKNINGNNNIPESGEAAGKHDEEPTMHMDDVAASEQTGATVDSATSSVTLEQRVWQPSCCVQSFSGNSTSCVFPQMHEGVSKDLAATPEKKVSEY
jgi:hypothetical protein